MNIKDSIYKIKETTITDLISKKIPQFCNRQITDLKWRFLGNIPNSLAWKGQWYAYSVIKRKYLDCNYDLNNLRPRTNLCKDEKNVWVYWSTGIETAPDLVKKCHRLLKNKIPDGYTLHVVTEQNISDFVRYPDFVMDKLRDRSLSKIHFSDLTRAALLYLYGGIWLDSTCLLSKDIPLDILNSELFMFQANKLPFTESYPPIKSSSWFIVAKENENYLLSRLLQILLSYWQSNNRVIHYYLFHLSLAALVDTDEKCRKTWEEMHYICNMNPHVLWFEFLKEYTPSRWNNAINSCFVHKLSYKFDSSELKCDKQNLLMYFINTYEND